MANEVRKVDAGHLVVTESVFGRASLAAHSGENARTARVEPGIDTIEPREPKVRHKAQAERAAFCPLAAPARRRPRGPGRKDPWPPQIPPLPEPCPQFPEPRIPPLPPMPRR